MAVVYKCPSCGENMVFDSAKQMMVCAHCGNTQPAFEDAQEIKEEEKTQSGSGEVEAVIHRCPNCGAEVVTDAETAATFCVFCGAPAIIPEKVSGALKPSMIIPFKFSKNDAIEAFTKHCRKGRVTPKGYFSQERMDKISGVYVPFFLYDCDGNTKMNAECTQVSSYRSGNREYTETRHFSVYRDVDTSFRRVPADASEKMDDNLMDKLEPFNYGELKPFAMPYLSGYMAEKYGLDEKQLLGRAMNRIQSYSKDYVRSTIHGYSTVNVLNSNFTCRREEATYVLLPVWISNFDYKGKKYTFAMNGQTGKVVAKLPISIGKCAAWFGGISAVLFLIFFVIGGFLA